MYTILYIVRPGDTLTSIAQQFNVTPEDIARENRITDADRIYVGERIYITIPPVQDTYVVRPGDTLFTIANQFNTTLPALMRLNRIKNPNLIYPGQVIKIR